MVKCELLSYLEEVFCHVTIKMQLMRQKIADAYRELKELKGKNTELWKTCKQAVRGELRVHYLNRWREYIKRLNHSLVKKNEKKIEWQSSHHNPGCMEEQKSMKM